MSDSENALLLSSVDRSNGRLWPLQGDGLNGYLCPLTRPTGGRFYGSTTCTPISAMALAAMGAFDAAFRGAWDGAVAGEQAGVIGAELIRLFGVEAILGVQAVLAASGTEAHCWVGDVLVNQADQPTHFFTLTPAETGTHVAAAFLGAPLPQAEQAGLTHTNGNRTVTLMNLRGGAGELLLAEREHQLIAAIGAAVAAKKRVVVNATYGTKTGLVFPSLAGLLALKQSFPELMVVVDACQGRIGPAMLAALLNQGMLVILTGSKFFMGPAFSGLVLVPPDSGLPLFTQPLPDYPTLLRWVAAKAEIAAFQALPAGHVAAFFKEAGALIRQTLQQPPFALFPAPEPAPLILADGTPITPGVWDASTFVFKVCDPETGAFLSQDQLQPLHGTLVREHRLWLGAPVGGFGRVALGAANVPAGVAGVAEALAILKHVAGYTKGPHF